MYIRIHVKYTYSCKTVIKLDVFRRSFEKYSNIKLHENPSRGSRVFPWGRTNTYDEANGHNSQFCKNT